MSLGFGPRITRRAFLAWAGASSALLWDRDAFALEPEVPLRLQVDLLNRVLAYDKNFASRVHGSLSTAVVIDASDADSSRVGAQLLSELQGRRTLGPYPQHATRLPFKGTQALVEECKRGKAGIVYVTPGVRAPVGELALALRGLGVLTVGTMPDQVRQGLVLGFGVRSGKPRLLVNLTQARIQQVSFRADFLRIAEVVG